MAYCVDIVNLPLIRYLKSCQGDSSSRGTATARSHVWFRKQHQNVKPSKIRQPRHNSFT